MGIISNLTMIKNWGEFYLKEVFDYERGKRLVIADQIAGEIPYISSTKENNGIDNYITPPSFMTVYNNKIGLNNSGSIGYCFYHNYDFVASDHVTVFDIKAKYNQKLTLNIALFLKPIIEKLRQRYGFAREMNDDRLSKEIIALPKDKNGNPDWQFMEKYINEVGKKSVWNNKKIIQDKPYKKVDTSKWEEFLIKKLFTVKGSKTTPMFDILDAEYGDYSYVTTKAVNNGVECCIELWTEEGNVLTIDSAVTGYCGYQDNNFCASDHVEKLIPKFNMNMHIALFIRAIINQEKFRYNYGRKFNQIRIKNTIIKLPATQQGEPDWQFMENYIKSLPYSCSL